MTICVVLLSPIVLLRYVTIKY